MDKEIAVRLFSTSTCSGSCCACSPNPDMVAFEKAAEKLVEKFGTERLRFEAYGSDDAKKFPFLHAAGKIKLPVVAIGERIVAQGKFPAVSELEKEVGRLLKKVK
jgi:hypothetical protein